MWEVTDRSGNVLFALAAPSMAEAAMLLAYDERSPEGAFVRAARV